MGTTATHEPDRARATRSALGAIVCLCMALPVYAATWRVERDGSGDFTTIQPAADAAASGDTILVGPGHYTEYTVYKTADKITFNYYVLFNQNNLTILGVDRDLVTIGPSLAAGFDNEAVGLSGLTANGHSLLIERITFSHCRTGIAAAEENVTVRDCLFLDNETGFKSSATVSVLVENCEFIENSSRGVLQFDAAATPLLIVRNSQFTDNSYGIDSQEENNLVENCTFRGNSAAALQYSARAVGTVRNCEFFDNDAAIYATSQTQIDLRDNQVWGGDGNLALINGSHATGSGNIFGGASFATIYLTGQSTATMSANHILQGTSPWRVRLASTSGSGHTIDLRNNYWGTSSAEQIAASIFDSQDNPTPIGNITGTVLFEPFFELPIATRTTSFGEFKRLFLPGN